MKVQKIVIVCDYPGCGQEDASAEVRLSMTVAGSGSWHATLDLCVPHAVALREAGHANDGGSTRSSPERERPAAPALPRGSYGVIRAELLEAYERREDEVPLASVRTMFAGEPA